jgi:pectate lyase
MRFFEITSTALVAASTALGAPLERRAAKIDELVGFAAGTTGGGSGSGTFEQPLVKIHQVFAH